MELPDIQLVLETQESLVNKLSVEIEKARAALETLEYRWNKENDTLQRYKAMLSPIHRLSDDLLSLIFLASQPPWDESNFQKARLTNMTAKHPSVVLSHVCQHWRTVALNNAVMWSTIKIHIPQHPLLAMNIQSESPLSPAMQKQIYQEESKRWEALLERLRDILDVWLERSRGSPLAISFYVYETFLNITAIAIPPSYAQVIQVAKQRVGWIVERIRHASTRWRDVELCFMIGLDDSPLLSLFQLPNERTPILRSLFLAPIFDSARDWDTGVLDDVLGSILRHRDPSLQSLKLHGMWRPFNELGVDWSNLTELDIGGIFPLNARSNPSAILGPTRPFVGPQQALSLLKLCPRLIHFGITFQSDPSRFVSISHVDHPSGPDMRHASDMVFLNSLQTLELRGTPVPLAFVELLALPSLHTLIIASQREYSSHPQVENGIAELMRSVGNQVVSLGIEYTSFSSHGLLSCLQSAPNVRQLTLGSRLAMQGHGDHIQDPVITPDVLHKIASSLCPNLEKFQCIADSSLVQDSHLVDFIRCKRSSQGIEGRLRYARIRLPRFKEGDIKARLEETQVDVQGLELVVLHRARPVQPPEFVYGESHAVPSFETYVEKLLSEP